MLAKSPESSGFRCLYRVKCPKVKTKEVSFLIKLRTFWPSNSLNVLAYESVPE